MVKRLMTGPARGGSASSAWLLGAFIVGLVPHLAAAKPTPPTLPSHQCSDPCLQDARSSRKECASSATGAFLEALDGCLERDHTCVDACRATRQDCRARTSVGADVAVCRVGLAAAKQRCRRRFPIVSKRYAACIFRAEVGESRCRRGALLLARAELRQCQSAFKDCAAGCGAGGPPNGVDACKSEGKSAVRSALAQCKLEYQVMASACINKDLGCVQQCGDTRETCDAPTRATLDAAIAVCNAQASADLSACAAANPNGGAAFDQCVETAQANAYTCRNDALQAAGPGLAACAGQYVTCIRACPSAQSGSAAVSKAITAYAPAARRCGGGGR